MKLDNQKIIQREVDHLVEQLNAQLYGEVGFTLVVRAGEVTRVNRVDTRTIAHPGTRGRS